jgi:hypothetical protein
MQDKKPEEKSMDNYFDGKKYERYLSGVDPIDEELEPSQEVHIAVPISKPPFIKIWEATILDVSKLFGL